MTNAMLALLNVADEGGFTSPFEVNFGLIFWTWVVFIPLFLLLKKYAWPPIVKAAEDREQRIQNQLTEAEKMNAEARALLEEHKQVMAGAKDEAQALINEAKSMAQKEREALLARAREEQEELLDRAKREIGAERERAVAELRKEAVDLSLAAASRLVREKLDDKANRRIVTDYLASLEADR